MWQLVTVLLVAPVLLVFITGAHRTCTTLNAGIDSSKVATMCMDSVVTGTSVYIDTTLAANMTSPSGEVCSCSIHSHIGKIMNVTTQFAGSPSSSCGGIINYASAGLSGTSHNSSCNNEKFEVTSMDMTVHFIKVHEPHNSKYCVSINQVYCNETEYQCDNGACIPGSGRCNSFPECSDLSDENNCHSGICLESQVLCNDGVTCILPGQKCDGNVDCPDSSDEPVTCGNMTTTSPTPTVSNSVAMVTITCTTSLYSPTVDMTTGISTNNGKGDDFSGSGCSVCCIIAIAISSVVVLILIAAFIAWFVFKKKQKVDDSGKACSSTADGKAHVELPTK